MRVKHAHCARMSAIALVVSLTVAVAAENKANKPPGIAIKNFGCVNETYYRGAQPEGKDYLALASLGIKTVIDLEREGEANEQSMVESNGMKFFRLPMDTTSRPDVETVDRFLGLVNDPANQPVFVHCHGGRHRTGVMTAIYRLTHDRWTPEQAYGEMKQYEFGKGFGHGALKDYVYAYERIQDSRNSSGGSQSIKATAGGGSKNR
ncbi:MAG TPA: tyrosine-protein phosphatase [Blastocatellia bacterium]|nr:tyrosine-protein phosphatase [Blastocatellia bacterium]